MLRGPYFRLQSQLLPLPSLRASCYQDLFPLKASKYTFQIHPAQVPSSSRHFQTPRVPVPRLTDLSSRRPYPPLLCSSLDFSASVISFPDSCSVYLLAVCL